MTSNVSTVQSVPLFVDLDGTLIASDMLNESLLLAARRPSCAVRIPFWLLRGRAYLKRKLAERVCPAVSLLPFRGEVVRYLKRERAAGRSIILATATDIAWANEVAHLLELFDDVLASDGKRNLKSRQKLAAIEAYCRARGESRFAYMGDARADFPIWRQAAEVYVVDPSPRMLAKTRAIGKPGRAFGKRESVWRVAFDALRCPRWTKNLLLAAPLLQGGKFHPEGLVPAAWAIAAFCLVASSGYLFEELLTIEEDRRNGQKRNRPFASGSLPIGLGVNLALGLVVGGFLIAAIKLPPLFCLPLAAYFVGRLFYSRFLKRRTLTDVLWVAGFDTLRVVAGVVAMEATLSAAWILAPLLILSAWGLGQRRAQLRLRASASRV